MSRRLVWVGVFVLCLLTLFGLWFVTHVERVPVTVRDDPGIEARRNPHLALEMFVGEMGRSFIRLTDATELESLSRGGVLLLDNGRGRNMTSARVDSLLAWVGQGGYLIVTPEWMSASDPLLDRLGVRWFDQQKDKPDSTVPPVDGKSPVLVEIPGEGRFRIGSWYGQGMLSLDPPAWRGARQPTGDRVLHFAHGLGNITVLVNAGAMLNNYSIGKDDNAELVWALMHHYQPEGPVRFATRLYVPSLFDWLGEHAPEALVSLTVLLLLSLWWVVPRFGIIAAETGADRRALGEHLAAVGRYLWRAGGLTHWLRISREHFHSRLALTQPALAALPLQARAEALARATRLSVQDIGSALGGPADTPLGFTHAIRILSQLEHRLFEEPAP